MSARPHVVLILTDQQRADTIAAHGHGWMRTPHLDALVRGGVSFTNCHAAGATCTPSRAALFTGMYAHNTGCYSFNPWAHHRLWVQDLADAGYYCVNLGKMHLQPRDASAGFHERLIVENPTSTSRDGGHGDDAWGRHLALHGHARPNFRHRTDPEWTKKLQSVPWHLDEHLHSDVFTGDSAVAWIEREADPARPTFLQIGFPGPHEPWDPLPRHLAAYDGRESEFPAPVDRPHDFAHNPPQHAAVRDFHARVDHESRIDLSGATDADLRRMRKHYYAKVTLVDEQIGRVVAALERKGMLENSVVIVTSDHGEMLGDHGLAYKWLMFDQVTHVPLIVRDFRPGAPGGFVAPQLVSLIDLGPTVCELAGIAPPARLEGQSLAGYLRTETVPARRHVFCEDSYLLMIRSVTAKLVLYHGQPEGELYDLARDPHESRNLWNDPAHAALKQELQNELLTWLGASCLHTWGYKARAESAGGAYGVRWPRPDDHSLHGPNYKPRALPHL